MFFVPFFYVTFRAPVHISSVFLDNKTYTALRKTMINPRNFQGFLGWSQKKNLAN